ncbi:2-oxoglutarate dehydrogenase E1 subunit family protein, partial [Brachybacterium phenoliresistens]
MSQQTPPPEDEAPEFGPNQWLVDALHEQWTEDPTSVDPSWAEFFRSRSTPAERGVSTASEPVVQEDS